MSSVPPVEHYDTVWIKAPLPAGVEGTPELRERVSKDLRRMAMSLTGDRRDEVACILNMVAKDGLPGPRDLDVALDAIEQAYLYTDNSDK
jgi:hypothetical protein